QRASPRLGPTEEETRLPAKDQVAAVKQPESCEDAQDVDRAPRGSGQHQSRRDQADREAQKREDSLHAEHDFGPRARELCKGCEANRFDSLMINRCARGLAVRALREFLVGTWV